MFVVLEGIDRSGKTTLAEGVAATLREQEPDAKVELIHRGPPERDVLDEYALDFEDYRPGAGRHIVADRLHLGNIVYAPIYRPADAGDLTQATFRWVELFLMSRGARTWHVDQPLERIQARLASWEDEDYLKPEHVERVLDAYRELAPNLATFAKTIEPEGPTWELVEAIIEMGRYEDAKTSDLAPYASYVGSRTPRALLLGERRGGTPPYRNQAAFLPQSTSSGKFLMESLPDSIWRSVGIANAYEEDDLPGLLDTLADPPIIALGRAASDRLIELDIEHSAVPHPQYLRRFHTAKKRDYGNLIKSIMDKNEPEVHLSWPN